MFYEGLNALQPRVAYLYHLKTENLNQMFSGGIDKQYRLWWLRGLYKTFWGTTKKCENKNLS